MWVEIWNYRTDSERFTSSSSWGCELKCVYHNRLSCCQTGHPPREDVSWNIDCGIKNDGKPSHPPREDVSWNEIPFKFIVFLAVILLVRMWVEIPMLLLISYPTPVILLVRMWVEMLEKQFPDSDCVVILLVRMWVEISESEEDAVVQKVILLVRMWVEIPAKQGKNDKDQSSSSWGCELKCDPAIS